MKSAPSPRMLFAVSVLSTAGVRPSSDCRALRDSGTGNLWLVLLRLGGLLCTQMP